MTHTQILSFKAWGLGYKLTVDTATGECQDWLRKNSRIFKIIHLATTHAVEQDNKHCYTITVVYTMETG